MQKYGIIYGEVISSIGWYYKMKYNYQEQVFPNIAIADQFIKNAIFEMSPLYKEHFPKGQDVTVPLFTTLHSTSESILILLYNAAIFESDVLLRTVLEGTIKYCYLMSGDNETRNQKYLEYKCDLTEIDSLLDHRKALEAISILKEFSNNNTKPFETSVLSDERIAYLEGKYSRKKRNELKQKWSYGALLRELAKGNKEYEAQLGTMSSYALMSHFCHFDWTGVSSRNIQIVSAAKGDETYDVVHALRIISNVLSCYMFRITEYMRGNSYSSPKLISISMEIYSFIKSINDQQNKIIDQKIN